MNKSLQDHIEYNLRNKYIKQNEEWVEVYINPLNRIDITVVINEADILTEEVIEKDLLNILTNYDSKQVNNYSIGFIELYNIEDAEDLGIYKKEIKKEPITWSDVININKQKIEREKRKKLYKIISFYSYKGGVGRTIAMIQVAYLLAKQGKRVLLVDLDIEAPSLHRIFSKQIENEAFGIKYGLVDYLFEKTMNPNDSDNIQLRELFCELYFEEYISGGIYILPATKQLDSQYIFKLTQLQTNIIYENKYLENLIDTLQSEINIDTILIDSRTGLNQWGAFSLLGFADQIIFITYPNQENVEGTNEVIKIMKEAGLENYLVAMSKVVPTIEGKRYAETIFKKLDINQEESIDIPLDTAIATTEIFPAINVLEPYKKLSEFIIENDKINFNIEYLSKTNKESLITQLIYDRTVSLLTESQIKALRESAYSIIKYSSEKEVYNIQRASQRMMRHGNRVVISDEEGNKYLYRLRNHSIWEMNCTSEIFNFIQLTGASDSINSWIALVLYMINSYISKEESIMLSGFKKLDGKGMNEYIDFVTRLNETEIVDVLREATVGESKGIYLESEDDQIHENIRKLAQQVSIYIDISYIVDKIHDSKWLSSFVNAIKFLKKNITNIRLVGMIKSQIYEAHEMDFIDLKGSVISLEWSEQDVKRLLVNNINAEAFRDYIKEYIRRNQHLAEISFNEGSSDEDYFENFDSIELLNLIIGIRTDIKKYSEPMITYFYKKLRNLHTFDESTINNILKKAIHIQLQTGANYAPDRLLSIDSISNAFETI